MPRRAVHVPVTCAVCGTGFTVKPSRATQNNAITCSPTCIAELRRRNRIKACGSADRRSATCPVCLETFERKPSQLAKYATSYCGRTCRAIGIRGPRTALITGSWVPCARCGTRTWRTPATVMPHTYCSPSCAGKHPAARARTKPNMQGPRHWRWKGGVSFLPYAPGWTPALRRAIRARDGNRCRHCGFAPKAPGQLVVHHRDWGKTNHHPSNLVTLCRWCHARHHHGRLVLNLAPVAVI